MDGVGIRADALPHGVLVELVHLADGAALHLRPFLSYVIRDRNGFLGFDPRVVALGINDVGVTCVFLDV
jgi:hypothetical protein